MKRHSADHDPCGFACNMSQKVYRDIPGEFMDYFPSILKEAKVDQLIGKSLVDTGIVNKSANSVILENPFHKHPLYFFYLPLQKIIVP